MPRGAQTLTAPPSPPPRRGGCNSPPLSTEEREYLRRCTELGVAADPSVLTTLATRWWFLAPKTYFGQGGLLPLLDVLGSSTTITSLTLRSDPRLPVAESHAADARALGLAIKANRSLTSLDVSSCGLDDLGVAELAAAIRHSPSLKEVRLEQNAFGDAGCAALTRELGSGIREKTCASLEKLDISNNGLYFTATHKLFTAVAPQRVKIDAVGNYTTEEVLNALTHGIAFVIALVGSVPLLYDAWDRDRTTYWACLLYEFTLLCCFGSSTAYHALFMQPRIMMWFQRFDHAAIYLLIAGSYTPLVFIGCRGHLGAAFVVCLNWVAAFCGCCISAAGIGISSEHLNPTEIIIYTCMGLAVFPILGPVKRLLAPEAFFLLALGGAFYLMGIYFFVRGMRHPGWHVVWHVFVMAGAATHWFCVYLYILPSVGDGLDLRADYESNLLGNDFSREDLKIAVQNLMANYEGRKHAFDDLKIPITFSRSHIYDLLHESALASMLFNDTNFLNATHFAEHFKPKSYRRALRAQFQKAGSLLPDKATFLPPAILNALAKIRATDADLATGDAPPCGDDAGGGACPALDGSS